MTLANVVAADKIENPEPHRTHMSAVDDQKAIENKVRLSAQGVSIDQIPNEMLTVIFMNLNPLELLIASTVNKHWQKIALNIMTTYLAREKKYFTEGKDAPEKIMAAFKDVYTTPCPYITDAEIINKFLIENEPEEDINGWKVQQFFAATHGSSLEHWVTISFDRSFKAYIALTTKPNYQPVRMTTDRHANPGDYAIPYSPDLTKPGGTLAGLKVGRDNLSTGQKICHYNQTGLGIDKNITFDVFLVKE